MAQATEQQIRALETALAQQFFNLIQGSRFRINLALKYGFNSMAFLHYNTIYTKLVYEWIKKENKYELQLYADKGIKGIILSGQLHAEDFYSNEGLPKLDALVKKFDSEKGVHGIGFIPLLIWAIVAIAGFFTAKEITDDLTTTTQEKEQLLNTTAQTCKDLGLSPDQCNAMIYQTQAEASAGSGLGDMLKWGIAAVAALVIVPPLLKSTNN